MKAVKASTKRVAFMKLSVKCLLGLWPILVLGLAHTLGSRSGKQKRREIEQGSFPAFLSVNSCYSARSVKRLKAVTVHFLSAC